MFEFVQVCLGLDIENWSYNLEKFMPLLIEPNNAFYFIF